MLRLSRAHHVTPATLIRKLLAEYLPKRYLEVGYDKAIPHGAAINGLGVVSADWARVVGTLTGQSDLASATLGGWAPIVPPRGLIAPHRRWCTACYQASSSGHVDPLYWAVAAVTTCAIHPIPLMEACPACHAPQSWLSPTGCADRCPRCGDNLYASTPTGPSDPWDRWVATTVAEALREQPAMAMPETLTRRLNESIARLNNGITAQFARAVGYPKNTVSGWTDGRHRPSLEAILRLCAVRGHSLTAYLRGDPLPPTAECHPNLVLPPRVTPPRQSPRPLPGMDGPADPALSARQVAEQWGTSRRMLYYHRPEALHRRSIERQRMAQQVRRRREQRMQRWMTRTVHRLHAVGIYPSQRQVEARLPSPWSFHEAAVRTAWHRALDSIPGKL